MSHDVTVALSALGVAGQVIVALFLLAGLFALVRIYIPLDGIRRVFWGYELWAGFVVASVATGGSLFFSQIANYQPCELCWFQRICMYPLSILLLLMAYRGDYRASRYLFPLPVVGACVSIYHILIENHVVTEPQACTIGGAGCDYKWINEFGYMTIPTLALTGFLLLIGFLVLAASGQSTETATLAAHAER
ncbi:MAG TPA: disulfide bond formation protein B [Gaiellaceae bacterium]|nr:disulfide bond formation protein B [Gaiellaceae bacterium]